MQPQVAFLIDVDNTLIDNDRVKACLESTLSTMGGESVRKRFWELYEEVRSDLGAVSVPVTLERLRGESSDPAAVDSLGQALFATPFQDFVYTGVHDLLHWLRGLGVPVILSDGDPWFQAKKITDAGIGAAVGGNVLIFLHKERHVDDIRHWYPAERYVAVDDKANLLALLKEGFGDALTTIWVRQGHYAVDDAPSEAARPDFDVAGIADVRAVIEQAMAG